MPSFSLFDSCNMHYRQIKKLASDNQVIQNCLTACTLIKNCHTDFSEAFIWERFARLKCRIVKIGTNESRRSFDDFKIDTMVPKAYFYGWIRGDEATNNAQCLVAYILVFDLHRLIKEMITYDKEVFKYRGLCCYKFYNAYVKHLKWLCDYNNIKYPKYLFHLSLRGMSREECELNFIDIINKYIKLISNGEQIKRNSSKYEISPGIYLLSDGEIKQRRNRCKRSLRTSQAGKSSKQRIEL